MLVTAPRKTTGECFRSASYRDVVPPSGILYDRSRWGNHGTINGATWEKLPSRLYVLKFNGVGDYVKNSTVNWRSADSQGTVLVWFKVTDITTDRILFSSADEALITKYIAFGVSGTTGNLYISQRNADTRDGVNGNTNVNDGKFHLAAFISSGTAYSILLDTTSESLAISSGANTGDWFADVADRDNFLIGAAQTSAGIVAPFHGPIGLTLIYNRALSQAEIAQRYEAQKGWFGL